MYEYQYNVHVQSAATHTLRASTRSKVSLFFQLTTMLLLVVIGSLQLVDSLASVALCVYTIFFTEKSAVSAQTSRLYDTILFMFMYRM